MTIDFSLWRGGAADIDTEDRPELSAIRNRLAAYRTTNIDEVRRDPGNVMVYFDVPARITAASAFGSNSDLTAARSGSYTVYVAATVDLRQGDRLIVGDFTYRIIDALHNVTIRAERAYDAEAIVERGEAWP